MFGLSAIRLISLAGLVLSLPVVAGTLAESPLYLASRVPPNVLFSLSVEFPTANTAAYQGTNNYSDNSTYLGLFDSEKCYSYSAADTRFNPVSVAGSGHNCTGYWSGNFLNWATMTGLDEFRYAMTGGNRFVDTSSLTVLERTYQSGQGGTSNFPNKTYQGSTATPYPSGATLTIANQGKGTRMTVSLGGSGTALCTNPQLSGGSFSCDLTMQGTNETGACSTWAGAGTNADPYRCTTFGAFAGAGTPSGSTLGTLSTASTGATTETVTCANPSGTSNSNFNCTLTDSASHVGSCATWTGNGTSNSPFSCSNFGTFGGTAFSASAYGAASSYTQATQVTQAADTVTSCSIASASPNAITCTLTSGRTAVCANPGGDGRTGSGHTPYNCSSSSNGWTISGSPAASYVSNTSDTSAAISFTNSGGKTRYYYALTSVTYSIPVNTTYYYIPTYTGNSSGIYYYYSTYGVSFGGSTDYYVRLKVCDSSVGLESNCQRYPNGNYKPVGEIQRNGEVMRFGLFSYYKANDIDNAVMRSKLKYVAPNKWTSDGTFTNNTNKEWDANTGVFIGNPDPTEATNSWGGAVSNSGVINYVNKFGTAAAGYKTYDNVGKLYYETLKYLRGLSATSDFYSRSSTTNNDGFPVITSWDDPVQYSCQKNFIIAMGDTHTHCDKRLPGGTATSYGSAQCTGNSQPSDQGSLGGDNGVNVATWTNALGNLEGRANLANTFGFSGTASYYMSGLAYWAAKDGFRTLSGTAIKAKTYVIDVQEYGDQGVNSQYWYAAKYGGVDSFDANGNPLNWSKPGSSWPKNLLPAGNPAAMIAAVRSALSDISAQTGSGSDIGLSSGDLRTGSGTNLYSATYNSSGWTGDVLSYRMSSDLSIANTPIWRASTYLNPTALNPASGTLPWQTRRVITFNDGLNADGTATTDDNGRRGVDFYGTNAAGTDLFSTNLSPRQQALLNIDPASLTDDSRGSDRVDYIRGDNSNESPNGYQWRARTSSLGDVINSSPLYVRFPNFQSVPPADYATFRVYATNIANRTPVIYVGGNDGMLHVFNASDTSDDGTSAAGATANSGKELLAYVPSPVYSRLNMLTWTNYSHKYYVDGSPVVADVQLTANCNAATDANKCWRTLVTGGLNAGGQGIYALNGTNPSAFSSANANSLVFWEFTDRDDADLGYTFAQPIVRKMNNGKWAVIFGNGYNNTTSDGSASTTGRAFLFILFADGPGVSGSGRGNTWTQGTDYIKIELPAPNEGSTPLSPANGLSAVYGLDKNGDNIIDYLYAGDRYGNLWKIDVRNADPSNWASAFGTAESPLPLFTAVTKDTPAKKQQITTSPIVSQNPNGGYMVLFGTGSFVDDTDNASPFLTNSFYGIWDKDDGSTRVTSRSQLQKQATLGITSGGTVYAVQSNCVPQYAATPTPQAAASLCPSNLAPSSDGEGNVNQQLGWVLDLQNDPATANSGERYISSTLPLLEAGLLTFTTLTPSGDVCGGTNYDFSYNLDYMTGGAYFRPIYFTSGANSTPISVTVNISVGGTTTAVSANPSGRRLSTGIGQNPKAIYFGTAPGSGDPKANTGCTPFIKGRPCPSAKARCLIATTAGGCDNQNLGNSGRISWRQLFK